jgi:hypothetical protein
MISNLNDKLFSYMEELKEFGLDADGLKEFADGGKENNEKLYSTTEEIILKCVLFFATNNILNIKNDNGIKRRIKYIQMKNRFVDDIKDVDEKNGIFLKNKDMDIFIESLEFKQNFINLLISYSIEYNKTKQIKFCKELTEATNELNEINDKFQTFLIEKKYIITKDKNDIINKDDFLLEYNNYYNSNFKFNNILADIKRFNIEYDRQKQYNFKRGFLIGIKKFISIFKHFYRRIKIL